MFNSLINPIKNRSKFRFGKHYTKIGVSSLLIVILLILTLKILLPKLDETHKRWQSLGENENNVAQLSQKVQFLSSINPASMREQLRQAEIVLPSGKNIADIVTMVEGLAQATNTQVDSISFSPGFISTDSAKTKKNAKNALNLSLSFTGEKDSIESVLKKTEIASPLITVTSLFLRYSTSGLSQADINLKVYYLPLPSTLGEVSKPIAELSPQKQKILASLTEFKQFTPMDIDSVGEGTPPSQRKNLFSF